MIANVVFIFENEGFSCELCSVLESQPDTVYLGLILMTWL